MRSLPTPLRRAPRPAFDGIGRIGIAAVLLGSVAFWSLVAAVLS